MMLTNNLFWRRLIIGRINLEVAEGTYLPRKTRCLKCVTEAVDNRDAKTV